VRPDASGMLSNTAALLSPVNPAQNNRTASDLTQILGGPPVTLPPTVIVPPSETPTPTTPPYVPPTLTVAPPPQIADLQLSASAPLTVTAGAPFTLIFQIVNAGPNPASNLNFVDQFPDGASLVTYTLTTTQPGPPPAWVCIPVTGRMPCNLGSLPAGATITIDLALTAPAVPGPVVNTSDVSAAEADPNPADNHQTTNLTIY